MQPEGREKRVELPESVKKVLTVLESAGYEAWCVGGCVRDELLGRTPGDWDITTSARPEETLALFPGQAIPTGLQHGTVTVRQGEARLEVTTFRMDGPYRDHRRPDRVTFTSSLTEDLRRRDFTVNAMARNLRGCLADPFGGQADLAAGRLRCVGDSERRFSEDALRILRGLRFAAALDFSIEAATMESMHRKRETLRDLAPERIRTELWKLLCGPAADRVLRESPDIIGVFWPEILPMVGLDQKNIHHCYDVWEHSLHALMAVPPDPILRCSALLHDVGKPVCFIVDAAGCGHFYGHPAQSALLAEKMLRRLNCENSARETIVRLAAWHDKEIPRTERSIRRALMALGEKDLRRLIALKRADNLAQAPAYWDRQQELDKAERILEDLLAGDACVSLRQLAIHGQDLLDLGLRGPAVGRTLQALLEAVVDGRLPNTKGALLETVKTLPHGK